MIWQAFKDTAKDALGDFLVAIVFCAAAFVCLMGVVAL